MMMSVSPANNLAGFEAESAEQVIDVEGLLNWLDEVWLSGDLKGFITEDEFLKFRESVEQSQ